MPELPEVETTRRGIAPYLIGARIEGAVVRESRLRYPIPADLPAMIAGQSVHDLRRRGKYLLLELEKGTLLLHLGMSGSLRVLPVSSPPGIHDHVDLILNNGHCVRLHDPRRFGALLWITAPPEEHSLIRHLGPEPLKDGFDGRYLHSRSRTRRIAVKNFIMDARTVVGVGNIYANESLFLARIHPARHCNRISLERYQCLANEIKGVLRHAIEQGGTSLRDFVREDGNPGYFSLSLQVYGRENAPCPTCGKLLSQRRIGQRSSFFCSRCQH